MWVCRRRWRWRGSAEGGGALSATAAGLSHVISPEIGQTQYGAPPSLRCSSHERRELVASPLSSGAAAAATAAATAADGTAATASAAAATAAIA